MRCLEAGTHLLIEKPIAKTPALGEDLVAAARKNGVTLQVGHIERFNPAFETLQDIIRDLDVMAINIERLSPPINRSIEESAVADLMIHDIDILCSLLDAEIEDLSASGTAEGEYTTAVISFENGVVGNLTASRITQEKVRRMQISARDCFVVVDFIDNSVQLHRRSVPEFVTIDGERRYRRESTIEKPFIPSGEPLKHELEAFVEAVRTGTEPVVTGEDGIRALQIAEEIDRMAFDTGWEEGGE
jgi:predicted dehydrogenase